MVFMLALEVREVTKTFGTFVSLFRFSLEIREGYAFGLLGPNGAGKSTFIKIINGVLTQDSGDILVFGKPLEVQRHLIGIAPQEDAVYGNLTVMENLEYFASLYNLTGRKVHERAKQLLQQLRLDDKRNVLVKSLSGGMRRRLNLACALMHSPKILILDEPTTGLDPITRIALWDTVKKLWKNENLTIILTTHYLEEVESMCNAVAFINKGQLIAEGTPQSLKKVVGKELLKIKTVPGNLEKLVSGLEKIKGVESVTITESGLIIEADAALLPKVSTFLEANGEKVVEANASKPSLEDAFIKLAKTSLKAIQFEPS